MRLALALLSAALFSFVRAPHSELRLVPWTGERPDTAVEAHALAAGDVDGDGDLDLVIGTVGASRLWRNDDGRFVDVTKTALPHNADETNGVVLADLDGDGDLDLFLGNGGWLGGHNRLWLNDGHGRFVDASDDRLPYDYTWTNGVAAGDVDHDGDLDLLLAKWNRSSLYLNDGKGGFADVTDERLPDVRTTSQAVALADVDGDGDLDAVLGNTLYERNRLLLNDGSGRFTDATEDRLPADQDDTHAVLLVDVDGDGDLDLLCGNARLGGEQPRLLRNDGAGHFTDVTAATLPDLHCETQALAAADLDGDGDVDVILGTADGQEGAQDIVLRRDADGCYRVAEDALPRRCQVTHALLLADLLGKGHPALIVAGGGEATAPVEMLVPAPR